MFFRLFGFCKTCYYAEGCMGGCSWTTHVLFGKPGNNPFCHHRALELLKEGRRERIVRTQAPEGRPFDYGRFEIVLEPWPDGQAKPGEIASTTVVGRAGFRRDGGVGP